MLRPSSRIKRNQRVRAILLTGRGTLLFIKRIKPNNPSAYWVAPGGGVENRDASLRAALIRELNEELGAKVEIIMDGFYLTHSIGGKHLEEHFFVCRLLDYDLTQRHGPEFDDPSRGEYIPDEIPLTREALEGIYIKTPQLRDWLIAHLEILQQL